MAKVSVDWVCPSFWGPGVISSLVLDISDSDGVCHDDSLIFSTVCCNVSVVLMKP